MTAKTSMALLLAAIALLAAGLVAWMWTGEWRWAITGAVAFLVLGIASATPTSAAPTNKEGPS